MNEAASSGKLLIEWDEKLQMPVPVYRPPMNNQQIQAVGRAALSTEYKPQGRYIRDEVTKERTWVLNDGEEEFIGMTCLEVADIRQARAASYGDLDALNHLKDRTLGKPKQLTENVNVNATLQEALDLIGDKLEAKGKLRETVDMVDVEEYVDPLS